jgi:hypothetical protein
MKFSKNILTVFLTLLVFLTSTGMTVNLHFCAGDLQQVSMEKTPKCCIKEKESSKNNHCEKTSKEEDTCCNDEQIITPPPVKTLDSKVKNENSFVKNFILVKNYIQNLLNFETAETKDDEKPKISLFPLLKEGLYIILGQFRN